MLKRRLPLSASVFLMVLGVGVAYCLLWPPVYRAACLVVVQAQKIPTEIIQATVTTKIQERLQIITQQVLSRTRLMELIDRFNLYPKERRQLTPDELAQFMRKDISIKITTKNYFTIEYLYSDAQTVAAVTNALAAFYVDSNLRLREEDAVGTARFLNRELERMKGQLGEWENQITHFKEQHLQELPEAQEKNVALIGQLRLNAQHTNQMIQSELTRVSSYEQEQGTLEYREQTLAIQRAHNRAIGAGGGGEGTQTEETDPETIKKEIERLMVTYTDSHPDVQRLKSHLAKAEALKAEQQARRRAEAAAKGIKMQEKEKDISALDVEMNAVRASIERAAKRVAEGRQRIAEFQQQLNDINREIEAASRRLDNGPAVAEKLGELTRGYDALKHAYEKLQAKTLDANMAANLERTQRGEQFEVVDPAEVPDSPYRPDVRRAIPASFGLALVLGLALSLGLNYLDNSFTSVEQTERLGTFPVLVVLPALITRKEAMRKARVNMILLAVYGSVFLVLMAMVGILVTGRGHALKKLILGILG